MEDTDNDPQQDPKQYTAEDGTVGGQRADDSEKLRYDLIPPWPFYLLAQVYTMGGKKYGDDNWTKGMSWMRMIGSMKRHMEAFIMGESLDGADGQHHMASVAWGAFALMEYELFRKEFDDRPSNVLDVARALYEKASGQAPTLPLTNDMAVTGDLTSEDMEVIDKARELLATKAVAAGAYLTQAEPEPDVDPPREAYAPTYVPSDMANELATRPQVMDEMREADDLTEDERELLAAAEAQAAKQPKEDPDVREDRTKERAQRLAKNAPGLGTVDASQSIGETNFSKAQAKARRER